ncbi:type III helper protein HrpZ1, partial [Pseudomonas syringae pv. japonica str. M301072]
TAQPLPVELLTVEVIDANTGPGDSGTTSGEAGQLIGELIDRGLQSVLAG